MVEITFPAVPHIVVEGVEYEAFHPSEKGIIADSLIQHLAEEVDAIACTRYLRMFLQTVLPEIDLRKLTNDQQVATLSNYFETMREIKPPREVAKFNSMRLGGTNGAVD